MTKLLYTIVLLCLIFACKSGNNNEANIDKYGKPIPIRLYSQAINDTFSIFVSVPNDYKSENKQKYPVVYMLDANLYFDIIATTVNKYAEVGLVPPAIIVGIGYKDLITMDSLRSRDYTYPTAPAVDSFYVSGGAEKFLAFIKNEIIPHIDHTYNTDTLNRMLMGHSLGGYFTLYTLYQHLLGNNSGFSSYIAASPSIHYSNYYLLKELHTLSMHKGSKIKTFITYGGGEDTEDEDEQDINIMKTDATCASLSKLIEKKHTGSVIYKNEVYSNLKHMDTPLISFIKGMQWVLNTETK